MGMPHDLVIVRHGESEGNVATTAAKHGNHEYYTDEFMTTPGHQWRLTKKGRAQAGAMGSWLSGQGFSFDKHFVSPFVRTRETAAHLGLEEAKWSLNRALRERDWGDIGSLSKQVYETSEMYKENLWMQKNDPLYWTPPGGESIAQVAEDRVRNVLSTLHRECDGKRVLMVSHGEAMWAFRIVLERLNDEEYMALDGDKSERIVNCQAMHFTRLDPATGHQAPRLSWVRHARPVLVGEDWVVEVTPWREIEFKSYSNEELLAQVADVPYLIEKPSLETGLSA
jgi:broad specificity phosphatase PhoE